VLCTSMTAGAKLRAAPKRGELRGDSSCYGECLGFIEILPMLQAMVQLSNELVE
jgi:hypothetical protein